MAEIISLNRVRKAKAKAVKQTEADANRIKFGRTKPEKIAEQREIGHRDSLLDDAKRED